MALPTGQRSKTLRRKHRWVKSAQARMPVPPRPSHADEANRSASTISSIPASRRPTLRKNREGWGTRKTGAGLREREFRRNAKRVVQPLAGIRIYPIARVGRRGIDCDGGRSKGRPPCLEIPLLNPVAKNSRLMLSFHALRFSWSGFILAGRSGRDRKRTGRWKKK